MFGDTLSFFIVPVVGAVIGFSTNVLAIVMLFRPHRQIRIGGFVLPFTPGLIPKEKAELAKNIGEVLGESVLTPEALVEAVSNTGVIDMVSAKATKAFEGFLDDSRSLGDMVSVGLGISEQELSAQVTTRVHTAIDYISQTAAPDFIAGAGRGKKIGDLVPSVAVDHLKNMIKSRIPQSADLCRKILEHPTGEQFLRQTATKIIKDNAKGLIGMFINPDKIYDNMTDSLLEFLESDAGQALLSENADKAIDWLLEQSFDDIPEHARTWATTTLTNLAAYIKDEGHADKAAKAILSMSPADILPKSARDKDVASITRPIVAFLAEKAGQHLVDIINIPAIVEEKINEMDIKEMESLLLSVVGKQLKWIAILGGVLGFFIGFIPAIIS
ncbi:MAG: DUF445 family protein [Defluviitaleaceae bacterium]|nr:DUF445 family protein [Defluviitaleaceae bacterium]